MSRLREGAPRPNIYAIPEFRLKAGEDVAAGLVRTLLEEIEAALRALQDPNLAALRAVHAARRHVKRARTVLRLLRSVFGPELFESAIGTLRKAAHALAGDRDRDVIAGLARRLSAEAGGEASAILDRIASRNAPANRRREDGPARASELLVAAHSAVRAHAPPEATPSLVAAEAARLYARGRKSMKQALAGADGEALHDWRKRVKDRWHTSRVLKPIWPSGDRPRTRTLDKLGELLGADHDLLVLAEAVESERPNGSPGEADAALALIRERQDEIRRRVFALGRKLYGRSSNDYRRLWRKWAKKQRAAGLRSGHSASAGAAARDR